MSDLISRISLKQSIVVSAILKDKKTLEQIIDEEPSIDAVKHGRWKYISFLTVECSECKTQIHDLEYSNFCPNCGAKMDETVDE